MLFADTIAPDDGPSVENLKNTVEATAPQAEDTSAVATSPVVENSSSEAPSSKLVSSATSSTSRTGMNETPRRENVRGQLVKSHSVSTGTSPPPQSISTQVRISSHHLQVKFILLDTRQIA